MNRGWQVNWTASAAQQVHRRLPTPQISQQPDTAGPAKTINGGEVDRGEGERGKGWGESWRCLAEAVRFLRRHEGTLLLKAKGAGLAEVCVFF